MSYNKIFRLGKILSILDDKLNETKKKKLISVLEMVEKTFFGKGDNAGYR